MSNLFRSNSSHSISTVGGSFHPTLGETDSYYTTKSKEQCGPVCTFVAILFGVIGIIFFGAVLAFVVHVWFNAHPDWVW